MGSGESGKVIFATWISLGLSFVFHGSGFAETLQNERFKKGLVDLRCGNLNEARATFSKELAGTKDRNSAYAMRLEYYLIRVDLKQGAPSAQADLRQLIEKQSAAQGVDHPDTIASKRLLARELEKQGKTDEFRKVLAEVVESEKRILGEKHLRVQRSSKWLGAGDQESTGRDGGSTPIAGFVEMTPEVSAMARLRQTTYDFHKEKFKETITGAQNTIPLYLKFGPERHRDLAELYLMLGTSQRITGDLSGSLRNLERVQELHGPVSSLTRAKSFYERALSLCSQENIEAATSSLKKAMELYRSAGLYTEEALCGARLGRMLLDAGQVEMALFEVNRMCSEYEKNRQTVALGVMKIAKAQIELAKGDSVTATRTLDSGLEVTKGHPLEQLEGLLLKARMLQGRDNSAALSVLAGGLKNADALGRRDVEARLSLEKVKVLMAMGEIEEARKEIDLCVSYAQRAGDEKLVQAARKILK